MALTSTLRTSALPPSGPSVLRRGLLAGAVGTTVLNTVTYGDMALRGRDASQTPEQTVDALADALGRQVPGGRRQRGNRRSALGALSGTATGLAVGVAAGIARAAGLKFSPLGGAVVTGAAAMAASDVPMAVLGVSDPRTWTVTDWVSDALPHLAYGAAVHSTLSALDRPSTAVRRAGFGLVTRSALLGVASGSRSSLGFGLPTLVRGRGADTTKRPARATVVASVLSIGGELVGDKLPQTTSRLQSGALAGRFASAVMGASSLARRDGSNAVVPAAAAAGGAAVGSWGGYAWRMWAAKLMPDWQAALIEDAAAIGLGVVGCLGGSRA